MVDKYDFKSSKYLLKIDWNLTFVKKQANEYLKNYQSIKGSVNKPIYQFTTLPFFILLSIDLHIL